MAPSVGTIYNIIVDEDWLLMIICLRNRNIYYCLTFDFNRSEIAIKKDITADFLTIVQDVEKVSFYFSGSETPVISNRDSIGCFLCSVMPRSIIPPRVLAKAE